MKRDPDLAQAVRATAYFLWEQDGRPEGRSFDYWLRAKEMHLRQLAYDRWLAEGSPERDFYEAKIRTALFYVDHVLPQALALAQVVTKGGSSVVETDAALV